MICVNIINNCRIVAWYSGWFIYDGNKVFLKKRGSDNFNFNVRLLINEIKICVAYYTYCLIRIFHFIKGIFKICRLSMLLTNENIFFFFFLSSLFIISLLFVPKSDPSLNIRDLYIKTHMPPPLPCFLV